MKRRRLSRVWIGDVELWGVSRISWGDGGHGFGRVSLELLTGIVEADGGNGAELVDVLRFRVHTADGRTVPLGFRVHACRVCGRPFVEAFARGVPVLECEECELRPEWR